MTMNRFGFSPGEEALLGLLARHAAATPVVPSPAAAAPVVPSPAAVAR
jgi:hypothetical protein